MVKWKKNVFKELLFTFSAILLFTLIITFFVFRIALAALREEIVDNADLLTHQMQLQVDSSLRSLQNAAETLSYNEQVRDGCDINIETEGYGRAAISNGKVRLVLGQQIDIHPSMEEIGILYLKRNEVITSKYAYQKDQVDGLCERLYGKKYEDFVDFLAEGRYHGIYMIDMEDGSHKIIVCYPILSPREYHFGGVVIAELSQKGFLTYVEDSESVENCLITSNASAQTLTVTDTLADILQSIKPQEEGSISVRLDRTEYILTNRLSEVSDLQYFLLFNSSSMLQELRQLRLRILILLLFGLLSGFVFSYFAARYHSEPVKKLVNMLDGNNRDPAQYEYQYLEEALNNLVEKNKIGDEMLTFSEALVREYLLGKLLQGSIENEDDFWEVNEKYRFEIRGDRFCVAEILMTDIEKFKKNYAVANQIVPEKANVVVQSYLEKSFSGDLPISLIRKDNDLVCILCMQNAEKQTICTFDELKMKFEQIRTVLSDTLEVKAYIALSCEYNGLTGINMGYIEVQDMIDYAALVGIGDALLTKEYLSTVEQKETSEDGRAEDYMRRERSILNCILAGDYLEAGNHLAHAIDRYSSSGYVNAHILYHIINTIQVFLEDIRSTFSEDFYAQLDIRNRIEKAGTIMEKKNVILAIFSQMNDYMENQKSKGQMAAKQILDYIEMNYADPNLNREMLAKHFDMSVSSVSHIVKNSTGKTLMELVHKKRIQEARKLLLESDAPLQKIAEDVGYTNTWTLSRVFKNMTGVSPGKYREKNEI